MSERSIEKIISLIQTDDATDAPPDAVRWAKNLFAARAAAPQKLRKSITRRISAVLQIDLSPNKAAFGERSASASQVRQILFRAGENAIDLRIAATENGFEVRGQILGENFADARVKIGDFDTTANDSSEFKFAAIPAGNYTAIFQSGELEIIVERIGLK